MAVKTNDQIALGQVTDEWQQSNYPDETKETAFEYFSAEQILKDYQLDDDEIAQGIIGKGGDGGIDSIYVFVNKKPINEETSTDIIGANPLIELQIIQSKTSATFSAGTLTKFRETFGDLFGLGADSSDFAEEYNEGLRDHSDFFRDHYRAALKKKPKLSIKFHYATFGEHIHPNVKKQRDKLIELVQSMYSVADVGVAFHGAKELFALYNEVVKTDEILNTTKLLSSRNSYVSLCKIPDFYEFITSDGTINASIFEANIRDYQGNIAVNQGIRATLKNKSSEEFWYLNNGVTILGEEIIYSDEILTITRPQIVNGLQTSTEIYRYFSEYPDRLKDEKRLILVKVLDVTDEAARDHIISATNSQSNVPLIALRGTDEIHRLIDKHFSHNGIFYDRKKGFYKNKGKSPNDIVSLKYLAQSMMATILMRPDSARARPSSLLSDDDIYSEIFDPKIPLDAYLNAVILARKIHSVLKDNISGEGARSVINDLHWYVLSKRVATGAKIENMEIADYLASMKASTHNNAELLKTINLVKKKYTELGGNGKVAKGSSLKTKLGLSKP